MNKEKIIDDILQKLSYSRFRSSFHLKNEDIIYIKEKGFSNIKNHAYNFINDRLKPSIIINDGKQTPTKGHPVFIAQHATATCCRSCLEKWHKIPKGKELSEKEINYIVSIICKWMYIEIKNIKQIR